MVNGRHCQKCRTLYAFARAVVKNRSSYLSYRQPSFCCNSYILACGVENCAQCPASLSLVGVIVIGISVAPFLFVLRGVRRGTLTDSLLSMPEQRIVPMLFGVFCASSVFLILFLLGTSRTLIVTIATVLVGSIITLVITRSWKISLHLVGMTGSVTVLTLVYGPLFLLLSPLIILVGWARWYVHAHTVWQALAGAALAISVTLAFFWLFGLLF